VSSRTVRHTSSHGSSFSGPRRRRRFVSYSLYPPPLVGRITRFIRPSDCPVPTVNSTRTVGLPDGEKTLKICITVETEYWRVTDRRTNGRTDEQTDILPRHSPRYAYAARGKNHTTFKLRAVSSPGSRGRKGTACVFTKSCRNHINLFINIIN